MILTTFQSGDGVKLGIKTDRGILDVAAAVTATGVECPSHADDIFGQGLAALPALADLLGKADDAALYLNEADLTNAPAVPNPGKIICVGLNYAKHAAEGGMAPPDNPVLFSKFNNAIAAHNEDIPIQADWKTVDYESELGVVIGKSSAQRPRSGRAQPCLGLLQYERRQRAPSADAYWAMAVGQDPGQIPACRSLYRYR